jgi:single-stranded-DNA-specific exonuclease
MHGRGLEHLTEEDLVPTRVIDLEISTSDINLKVAEQIAQMEPFGVANPEPVFVSRNMTVVEKKPCKSPAHVQLSLRQAPDRALRCIAFNLGERFEGVPVGSTVDVAYKAEINHYRGNAELKFKIEDFK